MASLEPPHDYRWSQTVKSTPQDHAECTPIAPRRSLQNPAQNVAGAANRVEAQTSSTVSVPVEELPSLSGTRDLLLDPLFTQGLEAQTRRLQSLIAQARAGGDDLLARLLCRELLILRHSVIRLQKASRGAG